MSDELEQQEEEVQAPESYIMLRFAAPGSTIVAINQMNITPGQMIFIGEYLRVHGIRAMEQQILQHEQEEQTKRLAVPKPAILKPR